MPLQIGASPTIALQFAVPVTVVPQLDVPTTILGLGLLGLVVGVLVERTGCTAP